MVRASAVSHPGVRPVNEDSYLCHEELCLFVVADGIGGHAAGEVASRLAVKSIESFVRRSRDIEEYSRPSGIDTSLTLHGNRLRTALDLANRRLFRESEVQDDYTGIGTTVVSALIAGSRLVVGHVGESRLYVFTDGVLMPVTQDDSWAAHCSGGAGHRREPQGTSDAERLDQCAWRPGARRHSCLRT